MIFAPFDFMKMRDISYLFAMRFILAILALGLTNPFFTTKAATCFQAKSSPPACDSQRAFLLIQQQVEEAEKLVDVAPRINVLLYAANALWHHREEDARRIFTQAYELAEKDIREKAEEARRRGLPSAPPSDRRFMVVRSIARRDTAWAGRMVERIAEETRRAAPSGDSVRHVGGNFLFLAISMLRTDQQTAISIARVSFIYPAFFSLSMFLNRLAEQDQLAADQVYREAIYRYADAPIEELLYLSAYAFGSNHIVGPEASRSNYAVPQSFAPDKELQRLFLETFFHRAESAATATDVPVGGINRLPEAGQIYIALVGLEPLIIKHRPDYLERAKSLKARVEASLSSSVRQRAVNILRGFEAAEKRDYFKVYTESAAREKDPARRDQFQAFAILNAPDTESTEGLYGLSQKISDRKIRASILSWLYFKRTQKAIKAGLLEEARLLAGKVERPDHRAYLYYEIATETLKQLDDKARANEILDDVITATRKADDTNEKARTLLGLARLYARFDHKRAFEAMAEAIKTMNSLDAPDLTNPAIQYPLEGAVNAIYSIPSYEVAGFSPETTFQILGPFDFEGALGLARKFESRPQRLISIIALASLCFERSQK